ncbi:uncharacterized protein SETTUDRAFT_150954 [Exserohilum turcica Et28A]|uniref:Uncharacterized protein n=1 Tax=Exserohilum turcicum (strain 28A) TaxID=671987 RepID=R0JZS6_EXST2|nr:uncharacterized protein SETTUDRAFT_150954 [Exserohilum turcica Et28A]EOA86398.1 hypothetical protein SETTUDRAFT_150954 [Exserohilum turcica Et28A]
MFRAAMTHQQQQGHWLDKYATGYAPWTLSTAPDGGQTFKRPLGLVETSFDVDGIYYGGRADMNTLFTLTMQHKLPQDELRHRIASAWACLCLQHPLLLARVHEDPDTGIRGFAVDIPSTPDAAVQAVKDNIVWIEDVYEKVNENELYHHAFNTTRIIEPRKCLAKLLVLPIERMPDGTFSLRFLIVIAHQISDGLSAYSWFSHFVRILNQPRQDILADMEAFGKADKMKAILPAAQEDLYPRIAGNKARQRWFWALIRVLRHVKKELPPTFTNPLRREQRLEEPVPLEPKFDKIFDYSPATRPPMSCGHISASLSAAASSQLISLCRSAQVSVGAGCFALVGLAMMSIHETLHPSSQYPSFATSFPLNPRGFFANPPPTDSCMLAFCEGIVMPFLTSDLPAQARFKLAAKHANRELRVYQKRLKGKDMTRGTAGILDKHSPGRLLATGYIAQMEPTCGISSMGPLAALFQRGAYNLQELGDRDFAAEFRNVRMGVRARENEFLVGSWTSVEGIVEFGVSYDLNAISEERAEWWKRTIEGIDLM